VANLSKTLHINFYQNRSSIVEVMTQKFWCFFMSHSVTTLNIEPVRIHHLVSDQPSDGLSTIFQFHVPRFRVSSKTGNSHCSILKLNSRSA